MATWDGMAEEYGRHSSNILPVSFLLMLTWFMISWGIENCFDSTKCKDWRVMKEKVCSAIFFVVWSCRGFKNIYFFFRLVRQFKTILLFLRNVSMWIIEIEMNQSSWLRLKNRLTQRLADEFVFEVIVWVFLMIDCWVFVAKYLCFGSYEAWKRNIRQVTWNEAVIDVWGICEWCHQTCYRGLTKYVSRDESCSLQ